MVHDAQATFGDGLAVLGQTEGGEALSSPGTLAITDSTQSAFGEGSTAAALQWYALWTRSHCERLVFDQLSAKGFDVFLPTVDVWSARAGVRRRIPAPMFPGYLFLHRAVDKASYIEVQKARGLVCILGERWDRLAVIPDSEIEAIQTVLRARTPVLPHAFLREGQRVRVVRGPLAGVEGILIRQKARQGLLVLSVELLQRSIVVNVDCTWALPA